MFKQKTNTPLIAAIIIVTLIIGGLIGSYFSPNNYFQGKDVPGGYQPQSPTLSDSDLDGSSAGLERQTYVSEDVKSDTITNGSTASTTNDRLIVKTGNLSLVVKDVQKAIDEIAKYTKESQGFVVSSSVNKYSTSLDGNITVRVPATTFEKSLNDFKAMGEVSSENSYGDDITEEYIDLEARLKNLKATEEQFLAILKQAVKIEDVLAVQRELSYTRSEIERIEAQVKYLSQSAQLSTITIYLSTDPSTLPVLDDQESWKPWAIAKSAARSLVELGQTIVNGLIWLAVYIPALALLALMAWGIVRLVKKWRR